MYKCTVIGFYGDRDGCFGGQSIKTVTLVNELIKKFGIKKINKVNTYNWKRRPISIFLACVKSIIKSENIIIMPANNGLKLFVPLFSLLNKFFHRKLHYIVIGGWIAKFLKKHKYIKKRLDKFTGIYVETNSMKKDLNLIGLNNVIVLPNFKNIKIVDKQDIKYFKNPPYPLCTFSRVMKEKGIETAIAAIKKINSELGKVAFTLDIYGYIDKNYEEQFRKICEELPSFIRYCGIIEYNNTTETLKNYFALLFPTHFSTEGIPGTIIDSYCAGVPVISSKWDNFADIIDEGKTGIGYEMNNLDELINILHNIFFDINIINELRDNCIDKAYEFHPEKVVNEFIKYLN